VAALPDETILDAARRGGVPLGNACGGVGVCGRCRVTVVWGADGLQPATSTETRLAAIRGFGPEERLACQAVVRGSCAVTTSYW
jgi:adenylate cyclase